MALFYEGKRGHGMSIGISYNPCKGCKEMDKCNICELTYFRKGCIKSHTEDVVEVRHGYWIQTSEPKFIEGIKRIGVECSVCKIRRSIPAVENHGYCYCPNCGAKMDGERREENEG